MKLATNDGNTGDGMAIALDGCDVSCAVVGTGPPIVLLHGLGGSKTIWGRLRDELSRDFTVVSPDLRGAGATIETVAKEYCLETWCDDLRAVLSALGIARPALVGHSLGASIALKYALRWPDDVSALVLMGADPDLSRLGPRFQKVVELIGEIGLERWVAEHWAQNPPFSAVSLGRTPEILAEYRAMLLANDPEAYARTCRAIANTENLTGALRSVAQPALVIAGADDDRTLPAAGRELAEKLPNAEFVELAGVGHTMPLEAPKGVGKAIMEFLASEDGSGVPGRPPP